MDESSRVADLLTNQNDQSRSGGSLAGAGLLLIGLLLMYLISPLLLALLVRFGVEISDEVWNVLSTIWFPIGWYIDSGFPGGKEFQQLFEWIVEG